VKSIEDLQNGDRFLVGDERWRYDVGCHTGIHLQTGIWTYDRDVTVALIRANVPIERDIPYPEGGAEKWELREGDYEWIKPQGTLCWMNSSGWGKVKWLTSSESGCVYAIPKAKPQDKAKPAPKEYTVINLTYSVNGVGCEKMGDDAWIRLGDDFNPGDRVTVQRVSEQGEPR
jgi:hypothetical protein